MVIPTHWFFKLPIAKDRVRFLRLYTTVSVAMGVGLGLLAHRPCYTSEPLKPSLLYRMHLKRKLANKEITQEQYEKYLNYH